jgi:hypothetical protein
MVLGIGHNTHACPKIAQGMIELLDANGACDSGTPKAFFSSKQLSIAALHSSVSFTTSVDGNGRLLLVMSLIYFA